MKKEILKGLSREEAQKNLEKFGFNEITETGKVSLFKILFRQIRNNFVIYLLVFAVFLSFFVGKYLTAYVIVAVILVVIFTGFIQEYKAEKALEHLKKMIVPVSIVIRDGKEQEIFTREIVPDDILVLRNGEKIPADCIIIYEKDILLNESILTGESKEVKKFPVKDLRKYGEENTLFMGSFIVSGKCTAKVINTGMNTKFGKIANLISTTEKELPLQKKVNIISKYMVIFGSTLSVLTGLIIILRASEFNQGILLEVLIVVIAMSVSSFPEGFPVVLITALASGSYRMAKKNVIINRMSIIETLGETTVICSDKTGTITKGEMTARKIFCDNKFFEVTGIGYEGHGDFLNNGEKINSKKETTLSLLLRSSVLCNDATISRLGEDKLYSILGAPTEASLLIMASKANLFREDFNIDRIDEISFSSERKMMSILCKQNKEFFVFSKGALEVLLKKCKYIQRNSGVFRLLEKDRKKILEENKKLTSSSFRTISLAYRKMTSEKKELEKDLIFLGFVGIEDPPRDEVKDAVAMCRGAGIKVKMITGDDKETALSIAKQIGLDSGKTLEGYELDEMSDSELFRVVKTITIFARVRPEHKLRIVKALKEHGEIVTMTGDGVNDAPALKEAHIGVAMGKSGTDVSRSVADITLKNDNFATIVDAVKEGRTIFTNIQKFSTYQISINFAQVMLIFLAILLGLPLPLIAIQILFMNLFSDEIIAIALAFNPYSKDVMFSKPRKKSHIITKSLFFMLAISGLIMSLGSLGVFYYAVSSGQSLEGARTITLLTMVFFGITNAFNYRSFRKPTLNRSVFTNKYLVYASLFVIAVILLIVYSPINLFLETVPINLKYLIIAILVSCSILIVFDVLKVINEKKHFWKCD